MKLAAFLSHIGLIAAVAGCRDNARFSSNGDHYEGKIVKADFVRAGVDAEVTMCLVLDAEHLQDAPGTISTSDGSFRAARLRPIPQIWHDPLSTLSFGEGRRQNLIYLASKTAAGDTADVMVFLSLMENGDVEIRLLRGAPRAIEEKASTETPMFGVFPLSRQDGACAF